VIDKVPSSDSSRSTQPLGGKPKVARIEQGWRELRLWFSQVVWQVLF